AHAARSGRLPDSAVHAGTFAGRGNGENHARRKRRREKREDHSRPPRRPGLHLSVTRDCRTGEAQSITDSTPQISLAYWEIVRSLVNLPMRATFRIAFRTQLPFTTS